MQPLASVSNRARAEQVVFSGFLGGRRCFGGWCIWTVLGGGLPAFASKCLHQVELLNFLPVYELLFVPER